MPGFLLSDPKKKIGAKWGKVILSSNNADK
jgi:hypothetical protein